MDMSRNWKTDLEPSLGAKAAAILSEVFGERGVVRVDDSAVTRHDFQAQKALRIGPKIFYKTINGSAGWEGVPSFETVEGAEKKAREIAREEATEASATKVAGTYLAPDAMEKLFASVEGSISHSSSRVLAESSFHCGACHGTAAVDCGGCNGGGKVMCHNCFDGYVSCSSCGGRGARQDQNGNWHNCPSCYNGKNGCSWCGTSAKITCNGCRGYGYVSCDGCAATGWHTRGYYYQTMVGWETNGGADKAMEKFAHDRTLKWMEEGCAGLQRPGPTGTAPVMTAPPSLRFAKRDGSHFEFDLDVHGSLAQVVSSGAVGDRPYKGVGVMLDDLDVDLPGFLDDKVASLDLAIRKAAETGLPLKVAAAMPPGSAFNNLAVRSEARNYVSVEVAHAAAADLSGTMDVAFLHDVSLRYRRTLNAYAKRVVDRSWRIVFGTTVALLLAAFFFEIPWGGMRDNGKGGWFVAAAICAAVTALAAKGAVWLATWIAWRRQVPSGSNILPVEGWGKAPLVVLGIAFSLLVWPSVAPKGDPVKSVLEDVKFTLGLPRLTFGPHQGFRAYWPPRPVKTGQGS